MGRLRLVGINFRFLKSNYYKRIVRLGSHMLYGVSSKHRLSSTTAKDWIGDGLFYMMDILLFPELHEMLLLLAKPRMRSLTKSEIHIAQRFFASSIDYKVVRINDQMLSQLKKKAHAYVSINTINYDRHISEPILIHELVHVWQYQKYGSMYIYRALSAQRTREGYDYGGVEGLYKSMMNQRKLVDFNFEQQGAIIEDYCRLLLSPIESPSPLIYSTYEYYAAQLRD